MTSARDRRGPFRRALYAGRCPRCTAAIIKGISWVGLEYQSRSYYHADCLKQVIAARDAEIQAVLDGEDPQARG